MPSFNYLVIPLALLLASCGPAGVQRTSDLRPVAGDLERGLLGGTDERARVALGRWIEEHHSQPGAHQIGDWKVRFERDETATGAGRPFESLEPADDFRVHGLDERHVTQGIGVPMIGYRPNDGSGPHDRWNPPEGIYRPVTAVPVRRGHEIAIQLHDRLRKESVVWNGRRADLAGDVSAPWAALLEKTFPLRKTAFTSLITRDTGRQAGLFLIEDYDPEKTPVLFVHGLLSTPLMWSELTNDLWGDPRIRSRYQIWHYLYPTNAPALYPARLLRGQLDELRSTLDPELDDPAMQRTVVIAHSMGGLLSKTLVVEPRDAFWDAAFTKPLDQLDLTREQRKTLEKAWFWKPQKHVDRVIFCAVPFRGSQMADSFIGQIGRRIAAPRNEWQDFYRQIEEKNPGMLTAEYQVLTRRKLTSVGALSPTVRSLQILDELPVCPGIGTHVIVGTRGRDQALEDTSDGVVPYSSASLPGADSIKAVPSGHMNIHHPDAVAEIKRILLLPPAR